MSKKYVHSTCGQPMVFTVTTDTKDIKTPAAARIVKEIRIGGGAWVISSRGDKIPKVVITEVTDEELELLERSPAFQNMKRRGFMTIHDVGFMEADSRDLPMDHEKKDGTSQILDEDHAKGTDERIGHNATRATFGDGNQFGGKQPASVEESDYGPIRVA